MSDIEEIEQLQQQLNAHRRTLAILLRQVTIHTEAYVPPAQISGIAEARAAIARLKADLRERGVAVADQADDSSSPTDVAPPRRAAWRPEDRAAMLAKVRRIWIDGVLKQSLWNDALIALRLAEQPDAVMRPYGLHLRVGVDEAPLSKRMTVQKVYAAQQGALLILGQPGSGKTTLLLELTDTLLERAEQETAHPLPVVFSLATWGQEPAPLAEWLVAQLNREYDVPKKIGGAWVDAGEVLPLLDGLDEVAEPRRMACVEAINTYRSQHEATWATPIVVCCRSVEYATLPRLRLYGAIVVQPLTRPEIDSYLRRCGRALTGVRAVVKDDPSLYEALETPLLLPVMTLAFEGQPATALRRTGDPNERRRAIFAAYVDRVFQPPPLGKGSDLRYGRTRALYWLSWLAQRMREHNQSMYWIEFMRPDWLSHLWMWWVVWLISGLFGGIIGGLLDGVAGIFIGGVSGMVLTFGLNGGLRSIETVDMVRWNWRRLTDRSIWAGVLGGVLGSVLKNWPRVVMVGVVLFVLGVALDIILLGMLFILLLGVLLVALETHVIEQHIQPNECIYRSAKSGLVGGLAGGLCFGFLGIMHGMVRGVLSEAVIFMLIFGLVFLFQYGGAAVTKHYTLRLLLWLTGAFPWNITAFLDSCAQRRLVQRVGGGWRFPHNLIRDYFAELDLRKEDNA